MSDAAQEQLRERIDYLVRDRFRDALKLPGAVRTYGSGKGRMDSFLLAGMEDAVRILRNSGGHHRLVFSTDSHPAYEVTLDSTDGVVIEFTGSERQRPDIDSKLRLVASLPVAPNERVPYGWVKDGRIVLVIHMSEISRWRHRGMAINEIGVSCNVLKGEVLPAELKMRGGADLGWIGRFWKLIKQGQLVPLTDRLNNLPGQVLASSDGRNPPYLEFEATDGRRPVFATGEPYQFWHPKEGRPGELFGQLQNDGKPYISLLNGWFY